MPRMMRHATAQPLKHAIQMHIEQTEGWIERLERALDQLGARPGRKLCEGMRRLIEEAQAETEQHDKGPLMDVRITAAAQRIEHYEIAACGTIIALAKAAGEQQLADLPIPTLREEKQADETLTRIAESEINPAAVQRMQPANDARAAGRRSAAA